MVVLPFCGQSKLPDPEVRRAFGDEEAAARDGKLLYVGVTRARAQLLITFSGECTELLPRDRGLYAVTKRD
jgi:ATP-dependent exoDNAse (exonuclease V) beta subunit